jgi:N-methylhydantoinase A
VYDRARLGADDRIAGPAIVEQYDSTTVVLPGQALTVDDFGNLLIAEEAR